MAKVLIESSPSNTGAVVRRDIEINLKSISSFQFLYTSSQLNDDRPIEEVIPSYINVYEWHGGIGVRKDELAVVDCTKPFEKGKVYIIETSRTMQTIELRCNSYKRVLFKGEYKIVPLTTAETSFTRFEVLDEAAYGRYIDIKAKTDRNKAIAVITSPKLMFCELPFNSIGRRINWLEWNTKEITDKANLPCTIKVAGVAFPGDEVITLEEVDGNVMPTKVCYYLPCTTISGEKEGAIVKMKEGKDVIVFLSPQYGDSKDIDDAISMYATSVKNDLGWDVAVHKLTEDENSSVESIDKVIEDYYNHYPLKAIILVGEDISTCVNETLWTGDIPAISPWVTRGLEDGYTKTDNGCVDYGALHAYIVPSLLHPHASTFSDREAQIVSAFKKFATNRGLTYTEKINEDEKELVYAMLSTRDDIAKNLSWIDKKLKDLGDIYIRKEDPDRDYIDGLHGKTLKFLGLAGHGNPSSVHIDRYDFESDDLKKIKVPVVAIIGCGTSGWWSSMTSKESFGETVLSNETLSVIIAGTGGLDLFSSMCATEMAKGKTLVDILLNKKGLSDSAIIYGDPTFHYATK